LRPMNLRGVDAEQPVALGANPERIAVDDGQGGDSRERRTIGATLMPSVYN
jgi:hypothetical protein